MCCESTETLGLPREVIETLAHYRRLLDDRGWDWAGEGIDIFRSRDRCWPRELPVMYVVVLGFGTWAGCGRWAVGGLSGQVRMGARAALDGAAAGAAAAGRLWLLGR